MQSIWLRARSPTEVQRMIRSRFARVRQFAALAVALSAATLAACAHRSACCSTGPSVSQPPMAASLPESPFGKRQIDRGTFAVYQYNAATTNWDVVGFLWSNGRWYENHIECWALITAAVSGYVSYNPVYPHYLGLQAITNQATEADFHGSLPAGNVYLKLRHQTTSH